METPLLTPVVTCESEHRAVGSIGHTPAFHVQSIRVVEAGTVQGGGSGRHFRLWRGGCGRVGTVILKPSAAMAALRVVLGPA